MKKSDLYREWARVLDMCEGTEVDPRTCWKLGGDIQSSIPNLNGKPKDYEFAVAILEGRPVFVGDKVFLKNGDGAYGYVGHDWIDITEKHYLLNQPEKKRKTMMLNGVELSAPVANSEGIRLDFLGIDYFFETVEDRNKVALEITNLLEGK